MPFTFSHPALILPLSILPRNYISVTGLVVGSMTPDFEYFLRMKMQGNYSHTLAGTFWFDLPLGILLAFIFHSIVRNPLLSNLPEALNSRLSGFKKFNWNKYFQEYWIVVIFSILIGAGSHLFWDSFTHFNGYFVELFKPLSNSVLFFNVSIPVFKIAQHTSTVLGGVAILIVLFKLPKATLEDNQNPILYWSLLLCIFTGVMIVRFLVGLSITEYVNIIVSCISALFIALIMAPLIMRMYLKHLINKWS